MRIDQRVISPEKRISELRRLSRRYRPSALATHRRITGWVLATAGITILAVAISPFRTDVSFPGSLLFLLLGVVFVAMVGGLEPALAAVVVAALAAAYIFAPPIHSFAVADPISVVELVVFAVVACVVSALFDQLTRRAIQVTRAQAEVEALARLTRRTVVTSELLPELVSELRRTFDLEGVAVLVRDGQDWSVAAAAGEDIPREPDDAPCSLPLDDSSVLVLAGRAIDPRDARLLGAFISQLRIAQEEIRLETQASVATELAEVNSVRTAILSAVSHDLRTPLASVKAAATSLLSDEVAWSGTEVRTLCETIDVEVDRLTALVDNLLDMSRLQIGVLPLSLRAMPISELLYSAVASLSDEGADVRIHIADGTPLVLVDAGLLERSLANVVLNAVRWSPPQEIVRVEAGPAEESVEVRVIDQGPGIPKDRRDVVFEAFQRLGDRSGGSPDGVGLGLAVAKGFVEAMGGTLMVEDTQSGGATFVFTLRSGSDRHA